MRRVEPDPELLARFNNDRVAMDETMKRELRTKISWQNIEELLTYLPQHAGKVKEVLEAYLGYIPRDYVVMPHEAEVRFIIEQTERFPQSLTTLIGEMTVVMKRVRSDDMWKNFWLDTPLAMDFARYRQQYLPYGAKARGRHVNILGFEPELEHSIFSELRLRKLMAMEDYGQYFNQNFLWTDYECATITNYRKTFLNEGKEAADRSAILGPLFRKKIL